MSESLLWGARFRAAPHADLMALSRADPRYFRLAKVDLLSSQAHARELQRAGVLTAQECETLIAALSQLRTEHAAGSLQPVPGDEDVHTFIERVLTERLGALGGKLRAGRSRNDQAANDLRLYLLGEARTLASRTLSMIDALLAQAQANQDTLAPGLTHLQPAQPITFAHQLLAHAQALARDLSRLVDWDRRSRVSPLGAAALAGSAIAVQPEVAARELGYDNAAENSIDAVASRDHVAEFLFVCAMLGVDLARLAEEIVLWSSRQFGWIELDDAFATGSSIMPQKKNPDIAELTRGRSARLISDLNGLLVMLKGLPFAYNRDLSEDKHFAFDAIDSLAVVLPAMAGLVRTMHVKSDVVMRDSTQSYTLATEVADWLARRGVPFARAHEITGALVRHCEDRGIGFEALTDEDLRAVDPQLSSEVLAVLTPQAAVAARCGYNGTAPAAVQAQLERLRKRLQNYSAWAAADPLAPIAEPHR